MNPVAGPAIIWGTFSTSNRKGFLGVITNFVRFLNPLFNGLNNLKDILIL